MVYLLLTVTILNEYSEIAGVAIAEPNIRIRIRKDFRVQRPNKTLCREKCSEKM